MQTLCGALPAPPLQEQWLTIATRGLSDDAVARVRAEIGDHYQSAFDASRAQGLDDMDAERRAVAALGDPKTANREYRRVLLTKWEQFELQGLSPDGMPAAHASTVCQCCRHFVTALITAPILFVLFKRDGIPALAALACFVATLVVQDAIMRRAQARTIRAGHLIRLLRWTVLAAGASIALASRMPVMGAVVGLLLAFFFQEYRRFVLRRKLPRERWPQRLRN